MRTLLAINSLICGVAEAHDAMSWELAVRGHAVAIHILCVMSVERRNLVGQDQVEESYSVCAPCDKEQGGLHSQLVA